MTWSNNALWWMHAIAGGAHLAQFAYGEALVNSTYKDKGFFRVDNPVFGKDEGHLGKYQLTQLAPLFSLCSAVNHTWSILDFQRYLSYVDAGYNPVRWAEYAVSASLMNILVGQLSGIQDVKILVGLVGANVAMQYVGYSVEKETAQAITTKDPILYEGAIRQQITGFLIFAMYMAVIFIAFFTAVSTSEQSVPDFVWSIIIIIAILYLAFGVLSLMYTRGANPNGAPKRWTVTDFRNVEAGYIVLSLVAKTFLVNMVLFGGIQMEPGPQAN